MSATELQRLRDRVEELEALLGVDRSIVGRIRDAFNIEPRHAQIVGMLLSRDFVTRDGLYTVLYGDLPEKDWPNDKILDAQICKLRPRLVPFGIEINTKWGEGWSMTKADKAKVRAILHGGDGPAMAVPPDAPTSGPTLAERRLAFLDGH
jgi:two-component system cell cycle response regulator CtrA